MLKPLQTPACATVVSGALLVFGCGSAPDATGILQPNSAGGLSAVGGMGTGNGGTRSDVSVGGAAGGKRSNGGSANGSSGDGGASNAGATTGGDGGGPIGGTASDGGSAGTDATGGSAGSGDVGGSAGSGGSSSTPLTITITDFDDAYVDSCNPESNRGDDPAVLVDAEPCIYQTLLKPSLSLLPAGSTVTSATLTLVGFDVGGAVDVSTSGAAWNESLARWSDRPPSAVKLGSFTPALGENNFDLTQQVQSWLNGQALLGLVLTPTGSDGSDYWSSDAPSESNRPRLVVTYTP